MTDSLYKPEKISNFDLFLKRWHIDMKFTRLRYLSIIPLFVGIVILNIGPKIFLFTGIFLIGISVVWFIFFFIYAEKKDLPYAIETERRILNDTSSNVKFNETVLVWMRKYYLIIYAILMILIFCISVYQIFNVFNFIKH